MQSSSLARPSRGTESYVTERARFQLEVEFITQPSEGLQMKPAPRVGFYLLPKSFHVNVQAPRVAEVVGLHTSFIRKSMVSSLPTLIVVLTKPFPVGLGILRTTQRNASPQRCPPANWRRTGKRGPGARHVLTKIPKVVRRLSQPENPAAAARPGRAPRAGSFSCCSQGT